MALINLKCPSCNGPIQMDDTKESGFCMYCGNKFLVKDELIHIKIEHCGSVNINRKSEIDNLIIRTKQKVDEIIKETDKKFENAGYNEILKESAYKTAISKLNNINEVYIEKALDLDPNNQDVLKLKSKVNYLIKTYNNPIKEASLKKVKIKRLGCLFTMISIIILITLYFKNI